MNGSKKLEITCKRRAMSIEKHYGHPFNLLHDHGNFSERLDLPVSFEDFYRGGCVFLDVKVRISVKNGERYLLSGSKCDFIVVYDENEWCKGVVLLFVLKDMREGYAKEVVRKCLSTRKIQRQKIDACRMATNNEDPGIFEISYDNTNIY